MSDDDIDEKIMARDQEALLRELRLSTDAGLWTAMLLSVSPEIRHEFREAKRATIAAELELGSDGARRPCARYSRRRAGYNCGSLCCMRGFVALHERPR